MAELPFIIWCALYMCADLFLLLQYLLTHMEYFYDVFMNFMKCQHLGEMDSKWKDKSLRFY